VDNSLKYLDFVREQYCCVCGSPGEPHHLKAVGLGRNRKKPMKEHYTVIPVCRIHHSEYHSMGYTDWAKKHQINPWRVANLLLAEWIFENQM